MPNILVCGLTNLETTVLVDGFPIGYFPVRYLEDGVRATTSGVGFNVARALTVLGNGVRYLSLLGDDVSGRMCREEIVAAGVDDADIVTVRGGTAHSAILVDREGRRQINLDLRKMQESVFPVDRFAAAARDADIAVLCNINFSRPLLFEARKLGKVIAADLHALGSLDDEYNRDWLENADILFMSHENLPCSPEEFAGELLERFSTRLLVIGLGGDGAMLAGRDQEPKRFPAITPRPVVNTIGAGDALFSAFLDGWLRFGDSAKALRRAIFYAGWKIGENGGAAGLISSSELDARLGSWSATPF
ncbi:MAG TPA: carbohydrate kinase family protein [Candidatus Ozemobacteraceae bacterium]|nr:carbohydrate kinase family protein [Candidatus Ozemobacteraceae bacterium]